MKSIATNDIPDNVILGYMPLTNIDYQFVSYLVLKRYIITYIIGTLFYSTI